MLSHSLHQFHENDLFTSAAAMSYFGLMALFPALLLLLAISNKLAAGSQLLAHAVDVYPGSSKFLRETIGSFSYLGFGAIITCVIRRVVGGLVGLRSDRARAESHLGRHLANFLAWTRADDRNDWNRWIVVVALGVGDLGRWLRFEKWPADSRHGRSHAIRCCCLSAVCSGKSSLRSSVSLITVVLFVVVYRFMPKAEVTLRDTLPGAFLGGLLWELAKYVFAWSLNYFHYDQIYGSVGAVVAVLTWSYVSSLILLFGAQLTAVFHREHPSATQINTDDTISVSPCTSPISITNFPKN